MDSYPPHLLRLPGTAPGSPARGRQAAGQPAPAAPVAVQQTAGQQDAPPVLLAGPGTPGVYEPPMSPGARPRNLTEMAARVTPTTPEPWPEGTYVQMGESGRRAHWTGTGWRGGVSPGYGGETAAVRSEPEQTTGGEQ